ncbi:MAG: nitrate reductase [Actinomycetia bacterium]|nr:nitrate reductase [Actinomycetes bacterium]
MHPALVTALGYAYPSPGHLETLTEALETLPRSAARKHLGQFVEAMAGLELGQWEELHTRTLDLSPAFVPYVGHVVWGENYRRGEFMADLKRDMELSGVDLGGELPDHIEPVLRYVALAAEPLSDLLDVLSGAVETMQSTLETAEKKNPYRHLLAATLAVVQDLKTVVIGGVR